MSRPGFDRWRRLSLALLVVSVVSLLAAAVVGVAVSDAEFGPGASSDSIEGLSQEDPNELTTSGGLSAYQRQLAERLASRARQASANLSSGDVDRARSLLDDTEYESVLSAYSNVSTGGQNESDVRAFLRSSRLLGNYSTMVSGYWDTHRNYSILRNATTVFDIYRPVDRGVVVHPGAVATADERRRALFRQALDRNTTLTEFRRTTARDLLKLDERINETGAELISLYRNGSALGGNETSSRAIRTSLANISETTREVREATFRETALRIESNAGRISAADPLTVTGRLRTANGTALEGRRIAIGTNETTSTTTDDDGAFSLTYWPVFHPSNTSTVRVQYVPNATAPYAAAETSINVTVERSKPTVAIEPLEGTVHYGDPVPVTGQVRGGEEGIPAVPVVATIDGRLLNRTETDGSGRFLINASLSGDVPAGEHTVRVRVRAENTTLRAANATTPLQVGESDTELSVSAPATADQTARVAGTLRLPDGTPVVAERVALLADGEPVSTVRTTANGTFETTISLPDDAASAGVLGGETQVSLEAVFEPGGGNLRPSRATATVTVARGPALLGLAGVGLALVAVAGVAVVWVRREDTTPSTGGSEQNDRSSETVATGRDPEWLLEHARTELEDGQPDSAVMASYAAVRQYFDQDLDTSISGTHWEFYRDCASADLDEETVDRLGELTALYERATFSEETVPSQDAESAIASVKHLVADA